jgi:hypothetical protein
MRKGNEIADNVIEIRVSEIAQLFHTLDPYPFREKDLDREAEEYIVGWARELLRNRPFRIVVHFPDNETQSGLARELQEAFSRYFAARAAAIQGDLKELLRIGRRSLAIGLAILIGCLLSAYFVAGYLVEAVPENGGGKLLDPGMGRELAAARNLPLRLVAACEAARSLSQAIRCHARTKAISVQQHRDCSVMPCMNRRIAA